MTTVASSKRKIRVDVTKLFGAVSLETKVGSKIGSKVGTKGLKTLVEASRV